VALCRPDEFTAEPVCCRPFVQRCDLTAPVAEIAVDAEGLPVSLDRGFRSTRSPRPRASRTGSIRTW